MFNAEKYIAECLNSLVEQTFQDFEVIVVDDCSTDSSVAIVESYASKFGGRLKLSKTKINSGGGGYVPRNIGLGLSRGEYIYFVDADDFIAKDALEILHTTAKNSGADVVYTPAYFSYGGADKINLEVDKEGRTLREAGREDNPTLTVDNPEQNLQRLLLGGGSFHMPWVKFIQRSFLIENEIVFPKIFSGGDFIWTIQVFCCAKKFLRIPVALYFYRENAFDSITREKKSPREQISKCVTAFLLGMKALQELSTKNNLLQNQIYFQAAVRPFFNNCLKRTFDERMQLNPQDVYEILSREFASDSSAATVPFLFSVIDGQQKNQLMEQQQFQKFAVQAQQRIAALENEIRQLKSKE